MLQLHLHLLLSLGIMISLWAGAGADAGGVCPRADASGASSSANNIIRHALPGCLDKCGNTSIPYPFGMGVGCHRNQSSGSVGGFEIICNDSFRPPKPFFVRPNTTLEIIEIEASVEVVHVRNSVSQRCLNDSDSDSDSDFPYYDWASVDLDSTPFTISDTRNRFFSIGCDTLAAVETCAEEGICFAGSVCLSNCRTRKEVRDGACRGIGCCSADISKHLKNFEVAIFDRYLHRNATSADVSPFQNSCRYAFIGDHEQYRFSKEDLSRDNISFTQKIKADVPLVLDWVVGNETCKEAQIIRKPNAFACGDNTDCDDSSGVGYRCKCRDGYEGNPYLPQGCQDIDECKDPTKNKCARGTCTNSQGGYRCNKKMGYKKMGLVIKFILAVGSGLVLLFVVGPWLYWGLKQRSLMKLREKFFKQNGGLILQQHISLHQGATETHKIFTENELKTATHNYDESRIVGKGGYGTVYKGILSDGRAIAIKKAKIVDKRQIEQFINEVKILSHINHRHVVKLVGSCLETEVPLLVYEYIPNGTLFNQIHRVGDDVSSLLSWENCLRIASETASALAYLHSAASIPIIHRDVKSANILLDDNYTAKVSDFGASRLVPMDKEHITTLVQGTLGYLDPEYLLTSQLTEKSDVYSFGVVLVEILTGKIPFSSFTTCDKERSLCQYFILSMKENHLSEIIDSRFADEAVITEQIQAVAQLAMMCLEVKGDERPTMRAVVAELEGLIRRFGQ